VLIAKNIKYESIGTVEFILDQDSGRFYFLEMNTRIQVEHPITEQISGVDLVKEQIGIAAGRPVNISQTEVRLKGHAIECRINAELAEADFRPSPGKITQWNPPEGDGIRVDTHCFAGYLVPPFYDSLLAKVIVSGNNRREAIERMRFALQHFSVSGVDTTIPFLSSLIDNTDFVSGNIHTRWIEDVIFTSGDRIQMGHC
jgi:acetyl-CoA carboxylase biotin carboxylase subunit